MTINVQRMSNNRLNIVQRMSNNRLNNVSCQSPDSHPTKNKLDQKILILILFVSGLVLALIFKTVQYNRTYCQGYKMTWVINLTGAKVVMK